MIRGRFRTNRADRAAAQVTGYPPLFYAIKRVYGDDHASWYLQKVHEAQARGR